MSNATPGTLLQVYRQRLGLSQNELAQKLGLTNDRTVRYWETSYYIPRAGKLKQILELLINEDKLTLGREYEEANRLWQIVANYNEITQKTRTAYPEFDRKWFDHLLKQKEFNQYNPALLPVTTLHYPLVGREEEVQQIFTRLDQSPMRLLTLTGPGGVGKTRLALEIASLVKSRGANGTALMVALASINEAELVLNQIASAAGLTPGAEEKPENLLNRLKIILEKHCALLVLDNFEQVRKAAGLVEELLKGTTRLKILVTSRLALDIYGEYRFEVTPLAVPGQINTAEIAANPAVNLFVQRAQAITPSFRLDEENVPAVAQLCRKLEGLPLALELAAARTRSFSPQAILERLEKDSKFNLLVSRAPANNERHQSLLATLDWSYRLLSSPLQAIFGCLALFVEGFDLAAAEAVVKGVSLPPPGLEIWSALEDLIAQSLLYHDTKLNRYRMLEIVREYALLQLKEQAELEKQARQRFFDYYLSLVQKVEPHLNRLDDLGWRKILSQEYNNIRKALEWSAEVHPTGGQELSAALGVFWYEAGLNKEARHWLKVFLDHPANYEPTRERAKCLQWIGSVTFVSGEFEASREFSRECLELSRRHDYTVSLGPGLFNAASLALMEGRFEEAQTLADEALTLGRRINYPWDVGMALFFKSLTLMAQNRDWEQARSYLEESLQVQRPEKYATVIVVLSNLGLVAARLGDLAYAQSVLEEGIELSREAHQQVHVTYGLTNLGMLLYRQGETARRRAAGLFLESLELSLNAGIYLQALNTLVGLAAILALPEVSAPAQAVQLAVQLLSAIENLGRHSAGGLEPSYQQFQLYQQLLDQLKQNLEPALFAQNWRAGQKLTFDNILEKCQAFLRSLIDSPPHNPD